MKLFAGILLLSTAVFAQNKTPITGTWEGNATVRGQQVPLHLRSPARPPNLKAVLINGPEQSAASSATFADGHLLITFNYFARTLDATLDNGQLTGTFGFTASHRQLPRRLLAPLVLHPATTAATPAAGAPRHQRRLGDRRPRAPRVNPPGSSASNPSANPPTIHAVIQRIDGDTGSLFGTWNGQNYTVSHATADRPRPLLPHPAARRHPARLEPPRHRSAEGPAAEPNRPPPRRSPQAKPRRTHRVHPADHRQGPQRALHLQLPQPRRQARLQHRPAV